MRLPLSSRSLSVRLVVLMTLALLPLGLMALYQTRGVIERAEDLARGALVAEAERAVAAERQVLLEAIGAARGLAATIPLVERDLAQCSRILREFIGQYGYFVFAGFLPPDGVMRCSSQGRAVDFSGLPGFQELIAAPRLTFEVNREGAASGQSVLISSVPIYDQGLFQGFVLISIPHYLASELRQDAETESGLKFAVLNREGRVLSATQGLEDTASFLPVGADMDQMRTQGETTFAGVTQAGERRIFATFPLVPDEVVVVGSWPAGALSLVQGPVQGALAVLFPILMWFAGVSVAYFGLHRLVIRHVGALRDAMRRFALGERDIAVLQLDGPSMEFAEAQRAFNRMALVLTDAEARREQDLRDKEVLLREVHHRVKNNLQMIASMMNMQSRTVRAPESKRVLHALQRRVQGLAAIHRTLYTTPDMTSVDVAGLAEEMVSQIAAPAGTGGARRVHVRRHLAPLRLYPDQAVPLSMVLSEMLTNAFKYVGTPEDGAAWIEVTLAETEDGYVSLTVENSRGTPVSELPGEESTGIGTRLMQAFVMQLDGVEEVRALPERYVMTVRFRPTEFHAEGA